MNSRGGRSPAVPQCKRMTTGDTPISVAKTNTTKESVLHVISAWLHRWILAGCEEYTDKTLMDTELGVPVCGAFWVAGSFGVDAGFVAEVMLLVGVLVYV